MSASISSGGMYLNTKTGKQEFFAKGTTLPAGYVVAGPTVSTGNIYTDATTGKQQYFAAGAGVPSNWVLLSQWSTPAPVMVLPIEPPPPAPTQVSTGTEYMTNTGLVVQIPVGQAIPADWTPATTASSPDTPMPQTSVGGMYLNIKTGQQEFFATGAVVPGDYVAGQGEVSLGKTYIEVATGKVTFFPVGTYVPYTWVRVDDFSGPPEPVTELPKLNPTVDTSPKVVTTTTPLFDKIATAIGILGAAGVAYVGYLYVMRPNEIKQFIIRFRELKELFVDSAQLMAAIATIAGISFVGYEFFVSYSKTGTFGGALGDMTARALEEMVTIIIEVFETLAKDLWNWFKNEIVNLWDSISLTPSWVTKAENWVKNVVD